MTIVLIGLVVMIFLGFVLKNLIKERKAILSKYKPDTKSVPICALCQHVDIRTDLSTPGHEWVHKEICTAVTLKIDYVTGQPEDHRLCLAENMSGRCERFRPIGDEE